MLYPSRDRTESSRPDNLILEPGLKCHGSRATMLVTRSLRHLGPRRTGEMRILFTDPDSVGDLVAYLRRCGCTAEIAGYGYVEAAPPQRPHIEQAYLRMELEAYLRVWREMHPNVGVELLDPSGAEIAS